MISDHDLDHQRRALERRLDDVETLVLRVGRRVGDLEQKQKDMSESLLVLSEMVRGAEDA